MKEKKISIENMILARLRIRVLYSENVRDCTNRSQGKADPIRYLNPGNKNLKCSNPCNMEDNADMPT
jgi:hypothetical protein